MDKYYDFIFGHEKLFIIVDNIKRASQQTMLQIYWNTKHNKKQYKNLHQLNKKNNTKILTSMIRLIVKKYQNK